MTYIVIPAKAGIHTCGCALISFDLACLERSILKCQQNLGKLTNLKSLSLADNQLSGNIPPELGNLTNLQEIYLSGNHLTGCIPNALRDVKSNDFADLNLPFCE